PMQHLEQVGRGDPLADGGLPHVHWYLRELLVAHLPACLDALRTRAECDPNHGLSGMAGHHGGDRRKRPERPPRPRTQDPAHDAPNGDHDSPSTAKGSQTVSISGSGSPLAPSSAAVSAMNAVRAESASRGSLALA